MMFSVITSKIFGGTTVALALALVFVALTKNAEIHRLEKSLTTANDDNEVLRLDNATMRGNQIALESSVKTCSASVEHTADVANVVARAGVAAVEAVKNSRPAVKVALDNVATMPSATCDDALAILRKGAQ